MTASTTSALGIIIEEPVATATGSTPNSIPQRPTKAEVLDAIMTEAECTRSQAGNVLAWVRLIVRQSRAQDYAPYYPTSDEMQSSPYKLLDAIMQHGTASAPGSAHALLEGYLLQPELNETALFHDNRDEAGSPHYCSIWVAIGVIR